MNNVTAEQQYISPKGVAEYLGCSLSTVWRLIRGGHLKSYKILRSSRVRISDLEDFINSKESHYG